MERPQTGAVTAQLSAGGLSRWRILPLTILLVVLLPALLLVMPLILIVAAVGIEVAAIVILARKFVRRAHGSMS